MARPARAQHAHAGRQRVRQERRERIAGQRSWPRVVLIEAIDQQHEPLATWHQRALGYALERRREPRRGREPRVGLWFARVGTPRLDLRHQRADQRLRVIPVRPAPADEVMRHGVACRLASGQPGREQRALTHPWPTGHHDPALGRVVDQLLIKPGQQSGAAHEPRVSLPLDREADRFPR